MISGNYTYALGKKVSKGKFKKKRTFRQLADRNCKWSYNISNEDV